MPAGLDGNPDPVVTEERNLVLGRVADLIVSRRRPQRPLLVGVDGIDGSGKSTFADEVARLLAARSIPVVRSTIDSFHRPRADRHRRGPSSPVGFYLDSHDLDGRSRVELSRLGLVLDGAPAGGDELVDHVLGWVARIDRYASGMRYYLDTVDPMSMADLVIDNNDLANPVILGQG